MSSVPFLLAPAYKDYIWGGDRLKKEYGKKTGLSPLAESWECSTHPDGVSIAASGEFSGRMLTDILAEHPEFLGDMDSLPILVKLIDARKDLSVQVHPDDAYAFANEGQPGKTELWYVLEAEPGSSLILGFERDVSKEEVRAGLKDGSIMQLLHKVPVKRGDMFLIEPGTVHAIGAGVLLAEVQENSNVTYRLYDYGRPRPLHIEKALDVAKLDAYRPRRPVSCRYFQVGHIDLAKTGGSAILEEDCSSFHVLMCIGGEGTLSSLCEGPGSFELKVRKGNSVFVPVGTDGVRMLGNAEFLDIYC